MGVTNDGLPFLLTTPTYTNHNLSSATRSTSPLKKPPDLLHLTPWTRYRHRTLLHIKQRYTIRHQRVHCPVNLNAHDSLPATSGRSPPTSSSAGTPCEREFDDAQLRAHPGDDSVGEEAQGGGKGVVLELGRTNLSLMRVVPSSSLVDYLKASS